jgi:hypothetical protein
MRKELSIMMALVLFFTPWTGTCSQEERPESGKEARIPAASDLQFSSVIVILRSGAMLGGALVGVESDAVVLQRKGQEEKIPRQDIRRITIEKESNRSRSAFQVMLLGTYLGNVLLFRAEDEPAFYLRNDLCSGAIALWETIIVGASTGLGFLLSGVLERNEQVFEFSDSAKENLANWDRLKRFIMGMGDQKKLHLSLQGGRIYPRISSRYKSLFQAAGYEVSKSAYCYYGGCAGEASDLNMLRKVQLTYSIKPYLDVGLAMSWLGERPISGYKEINFQVYDPYWGYQYTAHDYHNFSQQVSSMGYFAVGVFRPFFKQAPRNITWNVGFGVGMIETNFRLESHYYDYYTYADSTEVSNLSKQQIGALAFMELNFNLTKGLSLGFAADYAFAPAIEAPGFPEAEIPAQRIGGVNGSIGFNLGLHF